MKYTILFLLFILAVPAEAQGVSTYDTFSGSVLDPARWEILNEQGSDLADTSLAGGRLTVSGKASRTGPASIARLTDRGAVEVEAMGWTGTNQILQLYAGSGEFAHFIEFGCERTLGDGTPILHVWLPTGPSYEGASPVKGPPSPSKPLTLRIERNGTAFRFLANGNLVHEATTSAIEGFDARVVLYGWNTSVSMWDNVRMSGPECRVTNPFPGARVAGGLDVIGRTGADAATWRLDWGSGHRPPVWNTLAQGVGPVNGTLARWEPGEVPPGPISFRLMATNTTGFSGSYWSTVLYDRPTIVQPFEGQIVGPTFPVVLGGDTAGISKVEFFDNDAMFAGMVSPPFWVRRISPEGSDGSHTLRARVTRSDGSTAETLPVQVVVKRDLYGNNARPADNGRGFIFPNGKVGVAIAQNDAYEWPDLYQLWQNGDLTTTENYVRSLSARGVNVMRIMLEYAHLPEQLLERPLGVYTPSVVAFWDAFFPLCEKYGMTVLLTPWDTFWMNQPWSVNPYNAANGGPCATQRDFITSPAARQWQKNRFKYLIDRWGNSPAIFAIDLLNEFDIWWDPATPEERADWVNEMAAYVQDYELQKWGKRHMTTVSSANAEPGGTIGNVIYRHPRFEFANTHQYYGAVNDPQNVIDPALAVSAGVKVSLSHIVDGRPYTDSESGPISRWPLNSAFDDLYHHHMAWSHFASGGAGTGMRWPYRQPHYLSNGMHLTQRAVASASAWLNWNRFQPENADSLLSVNQANLIKVGSSDGNEAVVWIAQDLRSVPETTVNGATLTMTGLMPGTFLVRFWNTYTGSTTGAVRLDAVDGTLMIPLPGFYRDMAVTARSIVLGDLTGDGEANLHDTVAILRGAGGLDRLNWEAFATADVDANGTVDARDALLLVKP